MTAAQRDALLLHIDKQVDKINIQLEGNGNRGAFDRLDDIEEWQKKHPAECPTLEKRKNIIAIRALEVSIMGVVIGAIVGLLRVFI